MTRGCFWSSCWARAVSSCSSRALWCSCCCRSRRCRSKRVLDNLFDNIRKYADPAQSVAIAALIEDGALHICLSNSVNPASGRIESNKIGLRTCAKIMAQMAGGFKRYTENGKFTAEVILPIRAAEVSS